MEKEVHSPSAAVGSSSRIASAMRNGGSWRCCGAQLCGGGGASEGQQRPPLRTRRRRWGPLWRRRGRVSLRLERRRRPMVPSAPTLRLPLSLRCSLQGRRRRWVVLAAEFLRPSHDPTTALSLRLPPPLITLPTRQLLQPRPSTPTPAVWPPLAAVPRLLLAFSQRITRRRSGGWPQRCAILLAMEMEEGAEMPRWRLLTLLAALVEEGAVALLALDSAFSRAPMVAVALLPPRSVGRPRRH